MDAGGIESAGAGANRHFPLLEMSEESVPFSIGWGAIFFAGRVARRRAMNALCASIASVG